MIEEIRNQTVTFNSHFTEMQIKDIMSNYKHVRIFRGETCGVGKSDTIKNEIATKGLEYQRIPIYGELNRDKIIDIHKKKLYDFDYNNQKLIQRKSPIGIHFDVYPTSKEELNVIMFELLFLGSLSDYSCNHFYLPDGIRIFIEMS